MPQVAHQHDLSFGPFVTPIVEPSGSGSRHGVVGEMHRAIEERLLAGGEMLAVLPGRPRPAEALAQAVSRLIGWGAQGGCFATAAALLIF